MPEEQERRQDYADIKAEVRYIGKKMDDFIVEIRADRENNREDKQHMWSIIHETKGDIQRMKGVGTVMHAVWTATIGAVVAYIWSRDK